MSREDVRASVEGRRDRLTALSDDIWDYAETAFTERKSAAALCAALEQEGFAVSRGIGGIDTAFQGVYGNGGPVIGFLGEYDALFGLSQKAGALQKESDTPDAPGHGCGHNLLGVGALAAALAVKDYLARTGRSGTVIYFGTPGEEGGSGKAFMAREGCFDGLDAALTWHPSGHHAVRTASSLANIQASFRFAGVSSHAAVNPHHGRSALDAAELMNVGVNFMREHVTPDVRVHYSITNAGGLSPNVVQPVAQLLYLCRGETIQGAREVYDWVCDIARGAALMTQTQVEITFIKACSNLVVSNTLERALMDNMEKMPPYKLTDEEQALMGAFRDTVGSDGSSLLNMARSMGRSAYAALAPHANDAFLDFVLPLSTGERVNPGSTDVGDVSWVCPTAQINVATMAAVTPGHSWQTVAQGKTSVAHKGMLYAGQILAATAIDLLEQPALLEKARAEHRERVGPRGYVCPIPAGVKPRPIGSV